MKNLVELHLVSCSIVLTVSVQYMCVKGSVRVSQTVCLCGMYVCVCIGILSVTSQHLLPNFHWGRNAP